MSAGTRTDDVTAMVECYRYLHPKSLIFTKVDEARAVGGIYTAAHNSGLPVSYVCDGQLVPDDISAPTTDEVARWILTGHPKRLSPADSTPAQDLLNSVFRRRTT